MVVVVVLLFLSSISPVLVVATVILHQHIAERVQGHAKSDVG